MSIYGNNFLISIAYKAGSPNKAAQTAQLMGCTKKQIKSVREAAKILRDEGEDAFIDRFSPFDVVDTNIKGYNKMFVEVKIDRLYEKRPLNADEFNDVAELIERELEKIGVKATIKKVDKHPYVKSTL